MKGFTPFIFVASVDADGIKKGIADYYCNGIADEVQINLALADAHAMGGAFVYLSPGNFYLSDTILIGNNTTLHGAGPATKLQFAVTVVDKNMITNNCGYTFGVRHATGNWNISIRDMQIDGGKDSRGAGSDSICTVHFNTTLKLHIENLIVNNGWTGAIRTEFCTYVAINNNRIDNSGDDGIEINEETFFADCHGNHITNAGLGKSYGSPNGIEVQDGSHDISVHNNTIETTLNSGIEVSTHTGKTSCYNVSIVGNSVYNCPIGIEIEGITSAYQNLITISNNKILNNLAVENYPFYVRYANDVLISSNVVQTKYHGGRLQYTNSFISIQNNLFQCTSAAANAMKGFLFEGSLSDSRFSNNVLQNFGTSGLALYDTFNNFHVVDNHILDVSYVNGACIRWGANTSSRCRLDRNYLRGHHWSYDVATTTYDVLTANWTELWNEKHII